MFILYLHFFLPYWQSRHANCIIYWYERTAGKTCHGPHGHLGTEPALYIVWSTFGQDMPQADDQGRKYWTGLRPAIWQFNLGSLGEPSDLRQDRLTTPSTLKVAWEGSRASRIIRRHEKGECYNVILLHCSTQVWGVGYVCIEKKNINKPHHTHADLVWNIITL